MPHPTWRERFAQALRDQSLPRAKIDRLVEEISSHIDELITENPGMDAQALVESRLGSPERVAAFAKTQLWKIPLWSRPTVSFLIFAVCPIFAVGIVGLASLFSIVVLALFDECGVIDASSTSYTALNLTAFAVDYATRVLPLVVATWLFVSLGKRLDRRSWSIASCGVIAMSAFCYSSWVTAKTALDHGSIGLSLGFHPDLDHVLRAMLPILLATWMLTRSSSVSRNSRESGAGVPAELAAVAS